MFGVCFIQEIHVLHREGVSIDNISAQLSPWASALFEFLPPFIKKQVSNSDILIFFWLVWRYLAVPFSHSFIMVNYIYIFSLLLLLHPESDDSAQLSQVGLKSLATVLKDSIHYVIH